MAVDWIESSSTIEIEEVIEILGFTERESFIARPFIVKG